MGPRGDLRCLRLIKHGVERGNDLLAEVLEFLLHQRGLKRGITLFAYICAQGCDLSMVIQLTDFIIRLLFTPVIDIGPEHVLEESEPTNEAPTHLSRQLDDLGVKACEAASNRVYVVWQNVQSSVLLG